MTTDRLSLLSAIAVALQESLGIDERQAQHIAAKTAGIVRKRYSGEYLYIARRERHDCRARDKDIRRSYDRSQASRVLLMHKWNVSQSTFYQILSGRPKKKK